ncbi:MAG TPA: TonB-dependent receptor plug domain-containing protein, partial [Bacteroidales bacterium]|nr:TonB-dependent receptor plug domain-containing protein [Bacteroidales bacterium]
MTRKALVLLTLLGCFASSLIAQHRAEGVVLEHGSRLPVAGAHVRIGPKVTATDLKGFFSIDGLDPGLQTITVTAIGFEEHIASLQLGPGQKQEKMQGLDEVVVTATRSENRISDIPGRIEMISPEKLRLTASQSIDEVLALLPGVTVSRSFGLFSHKSTVSMRGLGGNEQARTLVLVDGIPVNKADGGSVNWNL